VERALMRKDLVRIGGASGFWGDSATGALQLVDSGQVDYLVFDYLSELTMSLLASARLKNPALGYATDFVAITMRAVLSDALARGIRIIANAGGVNPRACAAALAGLAAELNLEASIAVVEGDDAMSQLAGLRAAGILLPEEILSANAYLGALPIKRALDAGAQVVITGRCVDSALALGALLHEFDWRSDDYDLLAAASLAGHLIECGCQGAGGLHTDWEAVPDWAHSGYPIVACRPDGAFSISKPAGSGGLVTPATVAEQLLYEIGDPARYILPDVVCDFTAVTLEQAGPDVVQVRGAKGYPPTPSYKVTATYADGYRCNAQLTVVGFDAERKARRTAEAILERTRELFVLQGLGDYSDTHVEVLGSAFSFGPHAAHPPLFEAVMWLAVAHPDRRALELFAREIAPAGTSWAPGTTGAAGRPGVAPAIKQVSFLIGKQHLVPSYAMLAGGGVAMPVAVPPGADGATPVAARSAPLVAPAHDGEMVTVPLIWLAYARSGDKGDTSNIGVIARRPGYLPLLRAQLTEQRVAAHLAHLVAGQVTRFDVPGIHALNFVCEQALGGGGMASLRNDALGKGMAQVLLAMPVRVPSRFVVH
jgi:hypothetical protein